MRPLAAALALLATLPACWGNSCFVADTLVATPEGARRIADLAIGDLVYSVTGDGELVAREVTAVRRSLAATVCRVTLNGVVVNGVTPSHPLFDATRDAYVPLRDLKPDAELRVVRGGVLVPTPVVDIAITEHATPSVEVYDLTVEGPEHNFLADGVLVHNKSPRENNVGGSAAHLCGNGTIDNDEECDDGNRESLDGCSSDCKIEPMLQPPTTGSLMATSSSSSGGNGGIGGSGGNGGAGGIGAGGAGSGGT